MRLTKRAALCFSGSLWFAAGFMLMMKGIRLLIGISGSAQTLTEPYPFIKLFLPFTGNVEQSVLIIVVISLFIGTLKGRTVLTRAGKKMVAHIQSLPTPLPLLRLYPPRYFILLACMISLGFIRRWSGIADDIGGTVDLAIGCALVQGAFVYFRAMSTAATCGTANDEISQKRDRSVQEE